MRRTDDEGENAGEEECMETQTKPESRGECRWREEDRPAHRGRTWVRKKIEAGNEAGLL